MTLNLTPKELDVATNILYEMLLPELRRAGWKPTTPHLLRVAREIAKNAAFYIARRLKDDMTNSQPYKLRLERKRALQRAQKKRARERAKAAKCLTPQPAPHAINDADTSPIPTSHASSPPSTPNACPPVINAT